MNDEEFTDDNFEWEKYVTATYQAVIAESAADGTSKTEASKIATQRILDAIENGDVKIDLLEVIMRAIDHADKNSGKKADKLIADLVAGRFKLFDIDEDLESVVILGRGERKAFRYLTADDLEKMDELRYENKRRQEEAYYKWRQVFVPCRNVVRRFEHIGHAFESGAFDEEIS